MTVVNLEHVDRDTVALHDGPFHGQRKDRPDARMRKTQHAWATRMAEKDQLNRPIEEGGNGRVLFAVYVWLVSDQRYNFLDLIFAGSEEELNMALKVAAE